MHTKDSIMSTIEVLFITGEWVDTKDGAFISLWMGDEVEVGQPPDGTLIVTDTGETQTFTLLMAGADETFTFDNAETALIAFSDRYWENNDIWACSLDAYGAAYDEAEDFYGFDNEKAMPLFI
jgi:hypothetical protein